VRITKPALVAGAICVGLAAVVASSQTVPTASVLTGAYTEEQAIRGQALYGYHCQECHGEMMAGLDQAPPLVGPQFSANWDGAPLAALLGRIDTMPPSNPGSLSRAESVDVLSYILWYNGLPIGDVPLSNESSALAAMTFETPPLAGR